MSSSQLQVLGLTRQPHFYQSLPKSLPVQPPSAENAGMQRCGGAAQPQPARRAVGPRTYTEALQTQQPALPRGLGCR